MAAGRAPRRGSAILRQPRLWCKKRCGAPGKDRLSLGDDPGTGPGPVAEPPRKVVRGLHASRGDLDRLGVAKPVGGPTDVDRADDLASGHSHRRGDGTQADLQLLIRARVAGGPRSIQLSLEL